MLHDAELLLGLWRHLSAYSASPSTAALGSIEAAGKIYEVAWRLRGSGVSSAQRVRAIALEGKIRTYELEQLILPALQQLGWVRVSRDNQGSVVSVDDVIPPVEQLVASASTVLQITMPDAVQLAALEILRATSHQPLERDAAIEAASRHGEEAAVEALRHLSAINLVRGVRADDGRTAVFNPNIWVGDSEVTQAALRTEDARVRKEVGALLEEVIIYPGIPESSVTSTEQKWIDFAVSQGLIERSVVSTSEGDEKRFLFSPHLYRDPFGGPRRDTSGHVRQLVGSMIYAATFARYKLRNPAAFVRSLINYGEAGDASPIGTDYPMLETAGIVRVIPGRTQGRFSLELLQADVAEGALVILSEREEGATGNSQIASGLRSQRSYTHIERERAQLALETPTSDADLTRLVAALRQTTGKRGFRRD
jgi:hypothetical protein